MSGNIDGADFRLTIKVRNARLLRAIERAGYANPAQFAAALKIQPATIYEYIALRRAPIGKRGTVSGVIERIAAALQSSVEDLFPPRYMDRVMARSSVTFEMTEADVEQITQAPPQADALLLSLEAEQSVESMLGCLSDIQRRVLELHMGLNGERQHTFDELSKTFGVTRTRIQQIEQAALRKLRSPKYRQASRQAWEALDLGAQPTTIPEWRHPAVVAMEKQRQAQELHWQKVQAWKRERSQPPPEPTAAQIEQQRYEGDRTRERAAWNWAQLAGARAFWAAKGASYAGEEFRLVSIGKAGIIEGVALEAGNEYWLPQSIMVRLTGIA